MTQDPLAHLPPGAGPAGAVPAGHRSAAASARFPYLRAKLLQACANRESAEPLLGTLPLHPVEQKIFDWGRRSAVEALRAYPEKDESVRRNLPVMEQDLWRREVEDTAAYAFSLLSPIVEWRLDDAATRVVLLVEDHPIHPQSGEYDFGRVRQRRIELPLDETTGPDLTIRVLAEEHYVVSGIDPSRVEGPGEKPAFDPSCLGGTDPAEPGAEPGEPGAKPGRAEADRGEGHGGDGAHPVRK